MQSIKFLVLGSMVVSVVGVASVGGAYRGQLPPSQPPRLVEGTPGTRTDDGLAALPVAGIAPPSLGALGGSLGVPTPSPGGSGGALGR